MAAITGTLDPVTKALWDVVAAKWAAAGMNNPHDQDSPSGLADKADKDTVRAAAHAIIARRDNARRDNATMTLEQLEQETGCGHHRLGWGGVGPGCVEARGCES